MALQVLEQIKQVSTRQMAYQAIKDAILSGRLRTGERITETELADSLNISRAIVREALQQLAHEGLVEQNSYKGTRVVQLSPEQVDETISIRVLLETEAVRLAKERLTANHKRSLRSLVTKLENSRRNPSLYIELDLSLHEKIWEIAGNKTLQKMLVQVTVPLFAMGIIIRHSIGFATDNKLHCEPDDHTSLVDKICDGTTNEAVQAMRVHLTKNSSFTRENFERFLAAELAKDPNNSTAKISRSRKSTL